MKVFYDTEFREDGYVIDLISIGITREDGKQYYAVSSEFEFGRVARHPWLMKNVMCHIEHDGKKVTGKYVKSRNQIRDEVVAFLRDINPELWAYYSAYDHVALAQLFGTMLDLPNFMPMFTNDIKQLHEAKGSPRLPEQVDKPHHALYDSVHDKTMYDYLESL